MVREFVIVALVFFAMVAMASAAATSTAPVASNVAPEVSPSAASTIGAISGTSAAVAAPIGGPISASQFPNLASAPAPSVASALHISRFAGVAAATIAGFFL